MVFTENTLTKILVTAFCGAASATILSYFVGLYRDYKTEKRSKIEKHLTALSVIEQTLISNLMINQRNLMMITDQLNPPDPTLFITLHYHPYLIERHIGIGLRNLALSNAYLNVINLIDTIDKYTGFLINNYSERKQDLTRQYPTGAIPVPAAQAFFKTTNVSLEGLKSLILQAGVDLKEVLSGIQVSTAALYAKFGRPKEFLLPDDFEEKIKANLTVIEKGIFNEPGVKWISRDKM